MGFVKSVVEVVSKISGAMDSTHTYNPVPGLSLKEKLRLYRFRHRKPLRIMAAILGGIVMVLALGGSALYGSFTAGLPDVSKLDVYEPARTTKIYAADGTLIATLFDENRTYVDYDKIAPIMVSALVAIEDRRFFDHEGVDLKGIARALMGNASSGGVEQGASTLTMQLARRLFLTDERTYARKAREAVLAYRIDHHYSKEKILELYLNEVYFGSGAYGIDSAAAVYFGKNPDKLELWQAAMLAGLVQAPTAYSPLDDRKAALARMSEVLQAMKEEGKVTQAEVEQAEKKAAAYHFVNRALPSADGMLKYPYFTTYVIRQLSELFPDHFVRRGGLQVYTSLDIRLQDAAEKALARSLAGPGRAAGADTGAVVVIDNATGNLVAMVGGPGWNPKKQFNTAWQARRQPGSSFKMFIYSAALEAGYTPENEFADTESTFSPGASNEWTPSNSDRAFMGAIPLRTGLQFSRNLVSAKLVAHLGPDRIVNLAHRMGVDSDLPRVASLALGAGEVTPLQMARAFSALPTGGLLRPSYVITKVASADGGILKSFSPEAERQRVLSAETATRMCEMLHRVVTGGTAPAANLSGTYVAGKTGTTDNFKDAWFTGFTPHHTISVWIGRDDNRPMERVYGGTLPAEIFHTVAQSALAGHNPAAPLPGVQFEEPTRVTLCWDSTYLATPNCPKTYTDVFQAGVVPTRACPMHRQVLLPPTVTGVSAPAAGQPTPAGGQDPALSARRVVLTEASIPKELNPRRDPEVVTPEGALIPYREKAPSLAGVRFVIQGGRPAAARSSKGAEPTPRPQEEMEPEITETAAPPPLTESQGAPLSAEDDPALRVDAPRASRKPVLTAPIGVEPDYPTSPGVDISSAQESQQQQDEVIHQPDADVPSVGEPTIPPDPSGQ